MDMAVAEEYIEYYADKYKELTRKHKFAIPLCKCTDENEIYNAIETTSNIPAGYYITAECTRDVAKFAQKLHGKFGHKDGPFYADEVAIKIFLHDLENFLRDIYHTHFSFEWLTILNVIFFHEPIIFVIHTNLCLDCTFFASYSIEWLQGLLC